MLKEYHFVFFGLLLLAFTSCKVESLYYSSEPRYKTGDNKQWASTGYDDSGWNTDRGNTQDKVFWVRFHTKLPTAVNESEHLGVEINAFGAYEAYWDGVLLGKNGEVASPSSREIPGTETNFFLIPNALAQEGKHVLALRATQSYRSAHQRGTFITIADYYRMVRAPLIITAFMYILAGAFFIAAIYYFFLFINSSRSRKEYATLIFSLTCFLFFILLITEYIKFYVAIPYPHFYTRLEVIGILTFAIAFLVPLYFTMQFTFKRKKLFLTVLLFSLVAVYSIYFKRYDLTAQRLSLLMWLATLMVAGYATVQKAEAGYIVLLGLILSAVVNIFLEYDYGLFISFTIIVLCMLYVHAIRAKEIEKEYHSSLLLSARLKVELLKKNIQPHFIKNTLTSLLDWVEESPQQGAVFIQALAGEFDILNQIADATLIPVSQEIELCKKHLTVMQFRKEIQYHWEETGIDPHETIPPALIHTILENGITHSSPLPDGSIRFKLSFEQVNGYKKYTLLTTAKNRYALPNKKTGTGFRYIEARLKESYEERWEFCSEAVPTGWLTSIKIYPQS